MQLKKRKGEGKAGWTIEKLGTTEIVVKIETQKKTLPKPDHCSTTITKSMDLKLSELKEIFGSFECKQLNLTNLNSQIPNDCILQ